MTAGARPASEAVAHTHFVGIGGYGMSALAELLHRRGERVNGCDARPNARTARLAALGVEVLHGHDVRHLEGVERLVYSTDVPADLPERVEAVRRGVASVHRSEILALAMGGAFAVAVTGTHGKTTTTALTTHLLAAAGLDPTGIVGGELDAWGGGLRLGRADLVVAEADESDGSFLRYHPDVAVVTNVEAEHLEHYGGSFARVREAYAHFLAGVAPGGRRIVWADDPLALAATAGLTDVRRYGEAPEAEVRALDVVLDAAGSTFRVLRDGCDLGPVRLALPGRHNVHNALAAIEAALSAGGAFPAFVPALSSFRNAHRRFEVLFAGALGRVVDDYAHHPSEIRAGIGAARALAPGRLCVAFQPQRYSRTRALWDDFAGAFADAEEVVLLDIYAPAGERPLDGVSGSALAAAVRERRGNARFAPTPDEAAELVLSLWRPGDLWLFMGAGDVWRAARAVAARLGEAEASGATAPAGTASPPSGIARPGTL